MTNKKIVKYKKDGTAYLDCKVTDEVFLNYLGNIFNACVEKWDISYLDFSIMIKKYNLVKFVYSNFISLSHYGTPTVVEEIEKYIYSRGGLSVKDTI